MTTYKCGRDWRLGTASLPGGKDAQRSEEHTSELQSQSNLVCRLLLEKKKKLPTELLTPPWTISLLLIICSYSPCCLSYIQPTQLQPHLILYTDVYMSHVSCRTHVLS